MNKEEVQAEEQKLRREISVLRGDVTQAIIVGASEADIEAIGVKIDAAKSRLEVTLEVLEQFEPRGQWSGLTREEQANNYAPPIGAWTRKRPNDDL